MTLDLGPYSHSGACERVHAKRGPMTGSARTSDVRRTSGNLEIPDNRYAVSEMTDVQP
jgi:hypothetical protein